MTIPIKPCPFCGRIPEHEESIIEHVIRCECGAYMSHQYADELKVKWNNRANDEPLEYCLNFIKYIADDSTDYAVHDARNFLNWLKNENKRYPQFVIT